MGRILQRASELVDSYVRVPFALDSETNLPSDETIAQVMSDAACAQVEFWLEVGEDHAVSGLANRQVSIMSLNLSALPPELGPRCERILSTAGMLGLRPVTAPFTEFFVVPEYFS